MSDPGPLRVVLVEFHSRGALTQHTGQLADALARRGHDVRVLTTARSELTGRLEAARLAPCLAGFDPSRTIARGLLTAPLQRLMRGIALAKAWWDLIRFVARDAPDVVQLNELRSVLDAVGVAWLQRRRGRAVLVDMCHNVLPFSRRAAARRHLRTGPVIRAALASAYRRTDAIVVHGSDSRRRFLETWPGVGMVFVVPHGDARIFGGPIAAAANEPVVLFFGSWAGYKGLDVLFEAFAAVRARVTGAQLRIVGSPTREVSEGWVVERCAELGDAAVASPGYIPIEETRRVFADARVVALPYREGFQSAVAYLAFTLARPVVCTRVGDIAAAVDQSGGGLVVESGDSAAFADAVACLLEDPARAAEMGERARRWVMEDSSWDTAAERLEEVYRDAIARRTN